MKNKLLELGFTENETLIYEALVNYGEVGASELSKKVGIDRSVVYNILDNLILKGHVSYVHRDGKKKFFINKPESLVDRIQEKVLIANELIKEIKSKKKKTRAFFEVSTHEGKDALKVLDSEFLLSEKVYAFNVIGKAETIIPYHMAQLRLNLSKIKEARLILSSKNARDLAKTKKTKVLLKKYKFKVKVLPERYWNNVPIVIHNDIVLITTFEDDKPLSIRIKNKDIADAFRKDFEFMWKALK